MDISKRSAVERAARVLAARRLSSKAGGNEPSAAPDVDNGWLDHADDAMAVLRTLREPDEAMAKVGDVAVWERMIAAALGAPLGEPPSSTEPPAPGTDPLHEGP